MPNAFRFPNSSLSAFFTPTFLDIALDKALLDAF